MRVVRVLALLLIAGLTATACFPPPPPPPPPYSLSHLNGFFTGSSSYTNGNECPVAHELFFDIEYRVPNPARTVDIEMGGCVDFRPDGTTPYRGSYTMVTEVGTVGGRANGNIDLRTGVHELRLTADFGTGEFRGVIGFMRMRLECLCGFQPPRVTIPVNGAVYSLFF
jgi:hypothetical protein